MKTDTILIIHTDGGARGNPGPAAIGVVVATSDGKVIAKFGKRIGIATNNTAEYQGVVEALEFLNRKQIRATSVTICLDSQVVAEQLRGVYKVREPHLRELLLRVRVLEGQLHTAITYQKISREHNSQADYLVNQALDFTLTS